MSIIVFVVIMMFLGMFEDKIFFVGISEDFDLDYGLELFFKV